MSPESAIAAALDPGQRSRLLTRWETANPHQRGAHVADVLDLLTDSDSDLDLIEGVPAGHWPPHPAAGLAARAVIWSRPWGALRVLDPDAITALLDAAEWWRLP